VNDSRGNQEESVTTSEVSTGTEDHGSPKTYPIVINHTHYEVDYPFRTGSQLKALAQISQANQLFIEDPWPGDDELIHDGFVVHMRNGLHFYDVPVGNLGAS
jgi:hypothetical protein